MENFIRRHLWGLIYLVVINLLLAGWTLWRPSPRETPDRTVHREEDNGSYSPPPPLIYTWPTDQRGLLDLEREDVYMPPVPERLEGALYGSVRTARVGSRILPSFHEGMDIAPTRRDSSGRPLDQIYAVADGTVAFVNRVAGSSNYGIYVVILHADPVGKIYTLYSHLARVPPGLQAGGEVSRGEPIGIMGNTSSTPMPRVRSHLHFEIGMVKNEHFPRWYRNLRLQPDHGLYHGWNLAGIDPLEVYRADPAHPRFSMLEYLRSAPVAFEIAMPAGSQLDYFQRYSLLWEGEQFSPGAIVLAVSEGGVPLRGRNASDLEKDGLGTRKAVVLKVDEGVLGRNGRRLIVRRGGGWVLGRDGERWLEIYLASGN